VLRSKPEENVRLLQLPALALIASLLAPPARAALNPGVAARLASLTSEGEGTPVTETLLRRGDHPGTLVEQKLKQVAKAAASYLDASVRNAPWNDSHMGIDGPVCFDGAPKFGLLLRVLRLQGYVAVCGHHVFLIADYPEATLIIDPTIRQYFGQNLAPDWVPRIFVGTLSELKALYERDPGLPVLPYKQIYFSVDDPASRSDRRMLAHRDRLLSQPEGSEYAPLAEYLNRAIFREESYRSPLPGPALPWPWDPSR
jgi:hypothetical protein